MTIVVIGQEFDKMRLESDNNIHASNKCIIRFSFLTHRAAIREIMLPIGGSEGIKEDQKDVGG